MKYFPHVMITGLLIPFLPMNAETLQEPEGYSQSSPLFNAAMEEAPLTSLDEELSLLDEEFEEFKEELFSLEDALQHQERPSPLIAEDTLQQIDPLEGVSAPIVEEQPIAADFTSFQAESLPAQDEMQTSIPVAAEMTSEFTEDLALEDNDLPAIEKTDFLMDEDNELVQTAIEQESPAILNIEGTAFMGELEPINQAISIDLKQAFAGSPIIYSLLLGMSVIAVSIWLYSILSLRASASISLGLLKNVRNKLNSNSFDEALSLCEENNTLFCKMVSSGIHARRHGLPIMIETMKAEGKRTSIAFWQKIGLLNDIAVIAPMLGLLGTVLGMFYAFYDVNRSIESVSVLFDGLGISVGTTVAGLIVAILALILHSTAKYRLVRALALIENEAQNVATLIDDRTSIYKG